MFGYILGTLILLIILFGLIKQVIGIAKIIKERKKSKCDITIDDKKDNR